MFLQWFYEVGNSNFFRFYHVQGTCSRRYNFSTSYKCNDLMTNEDQSSFFSVEMNEHLFRSLGADLKRFGKIRIREVLMSILIGYDLNREKIKDQTQSNYGTLINGNTSICGIVLVNISETNVSNLLSLKSRLSLRIRFTIFSRLFL